MRSNRHVKIYLSIRQEAYAAHRSRNANAISASVVKIEYSREELRALLNHLITYYEKKQTLEDFLGFTTFPNTIVFKDEDVYDFMFRYSIGRPRDFVQFCDELSKIKDAPFKDIEDRRTKLKDKVREISSHVIIHSLFEELRMLLRCLNTQERFDEFLTLLKNNILTYSEMQSICCEFNGGKCLKDCSQCQHECHAFCDLYNMGLLGVVSDNQDRRVQHFKTPYEDMTNGLRNDCDYFLIHPALREYINKIHMHTPMGYHYNMFAGILIGEGVPWDNKYDELCIVNRWITQISDEVTRNFFVEMIQKSVTSKSFRFPFKRYNDKIRKKSCPIYEQHISDALVEYFTTKKISDPVALSIFVSYAYDSDMHKERVESFVDMLREMGFDAHMDSTLKERYPDIDEMMTVGLNMDKVIIVLSEKYREKADGRLGGVWKEFKMIADDLEPHSRKYIFVSFDAFYTELKEKISPKRIGNRWIIDLYKDKHNSYNELLSFIKGEKESMFRKVNETMASVKPRAIKPF